MEKPRLSQSLLKAYVDYYDDNVRGCGLKIRKQYFEKLPTPSSDAAKLGIYFEYKATDYIREGDPIPQPKMVYAGTSKEKYAVDYERAAESSDLFKEIVKKHDIEILKIGEYMSHDGCSGISDIRAKWKGEECIIDLKYSALIDDKWSEYGWHTESLVYKSKQLLQPIHYKYLINKIMGIEDIPFYYFVFSSAEPNNIKIIRQEVDESKSQSHIVAINNVLGKINKDLQYGFKPHPSMLKCSKCPINHKCSDKVSYPLIDEIYY